MFRKITTIYGIIDLVYYPTKIFGMAPYSRHIGLDKKITYHVLPFGFEHIFLNGGT